MFSLPQMRTVACLLFVALLCGCAGNDIVRGRLTYDLRPEEKRNPVFWPPLPETPRYMYVGELLGEPNLVDVSDKTMNPVINALKWIAGIFETNDVTVLHRPHHGTVDDKGRVYVVDTGRNAIMVFDPTAPAEEESDRGEGQLLLWEYLDQRTRFAGPVSAAIVWNGDLAVSDARLGLVARLDEKGQPVGKIGVGQLQRPTGLAFDPSRQLLFVADTVTNEIKVFDKEGKLTKSWGTPGEGPGEFNAPTHLAFANDRLYVSDTLNSRIQVFDTEGRFIRKFGQRGPYIGNLTRPKGVAVSDHGVTYVVESLFGHLLSFNEDDQLLMGIHGSGPRDGGFFLPSGVWTDPTGRIFVADMFNARVVVYQFLGASTD